MRVTVSPEKAVASPGMPVTLTLTVTNTDTVISGHVVRVLGVDPRWVEISDERLSLFPGTTGTCTVTLKLPPGLPAGQRRLSLEVRQITEPVSASILDVDLDLIPVVRVESRIEPMALTAGRRGSFGLLVRNTGNTTWVGAAAGKDEEGKVRFGVTPPTLRLAPGEHAAVEIGVKAKRRLVGAMVVRPLQFQLRGEDDAPDVDPVTTNATFVQKPVFGRGALGLLGLLAAVTVFALLITYALSGVVGRSTADRNLALEVAQNQNQGSGAGTASVAGTVRLLTAGTPVPGITVDIYDVSDTATPVTSSATDSKGAYSLSGLAAGSYKLQFRGAGFAELWYPRALTDSDGTTITLLAGQAKNGLDVALGGLPASLAGTIVGGDPTGTVVSLVLPGTAVKSGGGTTASSVTTVSAGGVTGSAAAAGATVESVTVGGDGTFSLANVPSPGVYDLSVAKTGYTTDIERINVAGGENRTGIQIRLRQGDGLISGLVSSRSGPLGDATVSASYNGTVLQTVSLTDPQHVGQFIVRGLPTPGTFTVVVSAPGYASQTLSLSLAAGQQLTGVDVTLGGSAGSLSGVVSLAGGGNPGGVTVTVTNGTLTVVTVTSSSQATLGQWSAGGLPIPNTYTVTFSRGDLSSQTAAVSLDQFGLVTGSSSVASASAVNATMTTSTATLLGHTYQVASSGEQTAAGEITIQLLSGTTTFTETSASLPEAGGYEFDGLPPGTYTATVSARGARPRSLIIELAAGQTLDTDAVSADTLVLSAPAQVSGRVVDADGNAIQGAVVKLYLSTQYPTTATQQTTTDASGGFTFIDLDAPQSYIVEYENPPGTPQASCTFTLKASEDYQPILSATGANESCPS